MATENIGHPVVPRLGARSGLIVQRVVAFETPALGDTYRPGSPGVTSQIYASVFADLDSFEITSWAMGNTLPYRVHVSEAGGTDAEYLKDPFEAYNGGRIRIPKRSAFESDEIARNTIVSMLTHEMVHALDNGKDTVRWDPSPDGADAAARKRTMRAEWRAWAVQAAVVGENLRAGNRSDPVLITLCNEFRDDPLTADSEGFVKKTARYLAMHKIGTGYGIDDARSFITENRSWYDEAIAIFRAADSGDRLLDVD